MNSLLCCCIWTACCCAIHLHMNQFFSNRRINISETDCIFSTKIGLKKSEMLPGQWSNRLLHPICQIKLVKRRIKLVLKASPFFNFFDSRIGIKYFLYFNYLLVLILENSTLISDFQEDITFYWNLSPFKSQSYKFFTKLKFFKLLFIEVIIEKSVSRKTKL